jgi:hypothetical protein
MLARSHDNSILRRRSTVHSSGDAQLPSDSSPLTHKIGVDQ